MKFILATKDTMDKFRSAVTVPDGYWKDKSHVVIRVSKTSPYLDPATLSPVPVPAQSEETGFTLQRLSDSAKLPILDYSATRDVYQWLQSTATPYRSLLISAMLQADDDNLECLRKGYPALVKTIEVWRALGDAYILGAGESMRWYTPTRS